MENNNPNIRSDKFTITSMEGITIIKKETENNSESEPSKTIKPTEIDLDNLPWEGNNYPNEIDYDDLV